MDSLARTRVYINERGEKRPSRGPDKYSGMERKRKLRAIDAARLRKDDEFYTRRQDIERILPLFKDELRGKAVHCNCDDYRRSEFVKYLRENFEEFGLTRLVATHYSPSNLLEDSGPAHRYEYDGVEERVTELAGDGDFRSDEVMAITRECDVVVTNPPFSLMRAFLTGMLEEGKDIIAVAPLTCSIYTDVFPYMARRHLKIFGRIDSFVVRGLLDGEGGRSLGNCRLEDGTWLAHMGIGRWVTTFRNPQPRRLELVRYDPERHPRYANEDAVNTDSTLDVPDCDGLIGVPISIMEYTDDPRVEFVRIFYKPCVGSKIKFKRILIRIRK